MLANYWSKRDHDFVQLLLRSPYIPTESELLYACACADSTGDFLPTILKFIKARKMDINEPIYGSPMLHQVAQSRKNGVAKVQLLLEHAEELNLNIFATNIDGETALQVAERLGKSEIVALLEPFFQN